MALLVKEVGLVARRHGGRPGIRDMGLLDSALARPVSRAGYAEATVFDLASTHAFGVVRSHPSVDDDKRDAFVAAAPFLSEHDFEITANDQLVVRAMLSLTDSRMDEECLLAGSTTAARSRAWYCGAIRV